jgi:glucose/arabinose dehydrogenase
MFLRIYIQLVIFFTTLLPVCTPYIKGSDPELSKIILPEGFNITFYASDVKGARSMIMGDNGTLFVGSRGPGNVYALADRNNDGKADEKYTIASELNSPNGLAFRKGSLYVAEINRILRYDNIENLLQNPPAAVVIFDNFPTEKHHGWKYIAFGPDDKLYVPVGAPCNICLSEEMFASITRINPDGSDFEIFAHGVRNTVGFDWHPQTGELWFTDNGRDWMGDDSPPDELNHAPEKDLHFGYPFCHGTDVKDPKFGDQRHCDEFTPPAIQLGPHVAALGMSFYTGNMFPEPYKNRIFIAEHGSWNRSKPIGYRVTQVELVGNKAVSYTPFAEGWLQGNSAWGRPVDVLVMDDGSLLVSDDHADAIYRISYKK